MPEPSLLQLLKQYGSAHTGEGTDKNCTHCYGPFYENLFEPFRTSVTSVLEIGACAGAFCLVCAEYFPNASVDGIDKTLQYIAFGKSNDRIKYHQIDATLKNAPCLLNHARYDIIIDDGSHHPPHQLDTLDIFAPYIRPGGVYVIEDIQTGDTIKDQLSRIAEEHGLIMSWHDLSHVNSRYDDVLAVFRRPKIYSNFGIP